MKHFADLKNETE